MGGGKQRIFGLEAFLVFELGGLQERLVAGRSARRPCDGSVTSKRTRWRQAWGWRWRGGEAAQAEEDMGRARWWAKGTGGCWISGGFLTWQKPDLVQSESKNNTLIQGSCKIRARSLCLPSPKEQRCP